MYTQTVRLVIGVQIFDDQALTFNGAEIRLPPPRTQLEAHQRLLTLTSLRPHWVGQRVRLLDQPAFGASTLHLQRTTL